jgi:NAD(P)H-hydrate repair Nnr-like enzyme with NAD(P)H-hydrate dehydratase domain
VLTPHPGEAGRLLQISTAAVQADRMAALRALTLRHPGAVIVLKGAGTLIGVNQATPRARCRPSASAAIRAWRRPAWAMC